MNDFINELEILYKTYDEFNKHYFKGQLKPCVITIQSDLKAYGYFTTHPIWNCEKDKRHEINISAENLGNRDKYGLCATLLHEMCHYYASLNSIKDTSRNGRYHNEKFKNIATERDLEISFNTTIGWSITSPTSKFKDYIDTLSFDFKKIFRTTIIKESKPTTKQSMRKYVCPCCGLVVRICKDNAQVKCVECDEMLEQEI